MNGRILVAAMVAAVAMSSLPAFGDSLGYYTPPKLVKQGTSTTPIAGNGTVLIQVLVNPDASFKVQKIIKSSNSDDNQAAMEIANSAKYAPAVKGGKKVSAFYTYTLKFVVNTKTSNAAPVNSLSKYDAEVHAGHYVDARNGLQSYLQSHPDDPQANALLGVSEFFLNNFVDSATAFNKAGTISPQYATVAANAYAKAAQAAISTKNGAAAVAYATKAKAMTPGAATWNLLGNAQLVDNDTTDAIASFEQARALSPNDPKLDPKERGTILANLIAAYADSDQIDKAVALLPEMKQLDPDNMVGTSHVVAYYARKALAASNAGKTSEAVAAYEKGGSFGGPLAHTMYTNEAMQLMRLAHPDWNQIQIVAGKAIALTPDDARANLAYGNVLLNEKRYNEAVPYLQKAQSSAKASGDADAEKLATQLLTQLAAQGASK